MENPQDETIQTYRENFRKYVDRTPPKVSGEFKEWMDSFISHLPEGGRILEIGSAVGRDARYFAYSGFKVVCTDVVPEALEKLKEEGFETSEFDFRDKLKEEWANSFDGLFANAVLLHAPQEVFESTLANIKTVLKKDGVVAFSLKTGVGEEISTEKMDAPRYFRYYSKVELEDILKKYPYEVISLTYSDSEKWLNAILKKK